MAITSNYHYISETATAITWSVLGLAELLSNWAANVASSVKLIEQARCPALEREDNRIIFPSPLDFNRQHGHPLANRGEYRCDSSL